MACRLNAFLIALFAGIAAPASAQALPDPTRPPGGSEAGATEAADSGLQSIIRPTSGKPRAVINGEVVTLGGKVGESRLVAINADTVILQNSDGSRDTLFLTPGISKKPSSTPSKSVAGKP
jgi:MSHA biogenesis protein MshK